MSEKSVFGTRKVKFKKHQRETARTIAELRKKLKEKSKRKPGSRIKTGIPGLNKILNGGIPEGNLVLITGGPGSGKTTFCLQFLYEGAKDYGEPGIFITLEESPKRLLEYANQHGWNMEEYISKGLIKIIKTPMYKFNALMTTLDDSVSKMKAKRVVIDPAALLALFFENKMETRKGLVELAGLLKKLECTALITSDAQVDGGEVSTFGIEEYAADGVITLYHTKVENTFVRMISILKMRGTTHSEKIHPLEMTKKGIKTFPEETVFQ